MGEAPLVCTSKKNVIIGFSCLHSAPYVAHLLFDAYRCGWGKCKGGGQRGLLVLTKVLFCPSDLTWHNIPQRFQNATLAARTDRKTLTPPRPTRQEIHGWRKSTPKEKKKRKQNTKRNARKRQHVFYFLCYFSTASASVTSCFFSTSDLWIVAAASVNCLSIVNCPSFGSWRHLEPPHSAPLMNMKTNFGHDFLWRRWWRGLLNLTFSCFVLFRPVFLRLNDKC